jgi:hypothetical protein
MNSTLEQKSTCLLTVIKLAKSTRNNQGRLGFSRRGALAPELLSFTVNNMLPKASLRTWVLDDVVFNLNRHL